MTVDEELAATLPIQPGMVIGGKYRIDKLLAAGGMGAVLKAHHEILDKPVAIKLIRPELATRREVAQRFLREARAAAKIASDNVARVTDVDMFDERTPFMVMEFLEGEDLHDVMEARGKIPIALAVDYALQALLGLDAAHARGVVHRDLKPSNLFLEKRDDGSRRVKLLDFGISKIVDQEDSILKAGATTSAGQMLGTPRYMSPEQVADAKTVDGRTDLWAIALILYEMLTGGYPFEGTSSGQILSNILTAPIPLLRDSLPDAPLALEEVLMTCLSKDREKRHPTAREMMKALTPFGSRRMRAIVSEQEEIAGSDMATVKSPAIPRAPTPSDSGGASPPSGAGKATLPTRIEAALRPTELEVPTKTSRAKPAQESAPVAEPPITRLSAHNEARIDEPTGGSGRSPAVGSNTTDAGLSVADSKASGGATWKIAAVAGATLALGLGFYALVRGAPPASTVATPSSTAPIPAVPSNEGSGSGPGEERAALVTPRVTSDATASAASPTAPVVNPVTSAEGSASSRLFAGAPAETAKPRPGATAAKTTRPTSQATSPASTGGMIRTRD